MATWTADELAQVRAAVIALAAGTRAVTVNYSSGGGSAARSVTYHATDLAALRSLLAEMQRSVSGKSAVRRTTHRKGFR